MRIIQQNWRSLSKVGLQVGAVGLLGLLFWWLGNNLVNNLNSSNIPTSFDFLNDSTNFNITDNSGFNSSLPFWRAVLIGIQNTVLAGVVGIAIAAILGVIIGIARLSSNWIVTKTSQVYVETIRNIPPLCIIIFFGFALFLFGPLPIITNSYVFKVFFSEESILIFSNSRIGFPSFASSGSVALFWGVILVGLVAAIGLMVHRTMRYAKTGVHHHRWLWSFGFLLAVVVIAFFIADSPYHISWPSLSNNKVFLEGGFSASAGYLSLTLALAIYTSSHIAEIVRGSIQSIPKGQGEAAYALNAFQKYRFVILPQALRVAMPPITSQFLNLMKNTSLGIAVAYPELTQLVRIGIGNGNPGPQSILVMMTAYLVLSLVISLIGNSYNRFFLSSELKAVK